MWWPEQILWQVSTPTGQLILISGLPNSERYQGFPKKPDPAVSLQFCQGLQTRTVIPRIDKPFCHLPMVSGHKILWSKFVSIEIRKGFTGLPKLSQSWVRYLLPTASMMSWWPDGPPHLTLVRGFNNGLSRCQAGMSSVEPVRSETPDCPPVIRITGDRAVHLLATLNVVLGQKTT